MAATNERGDSSAPQFQAGAFDAQYRECVRLYDERQWPQAERAAGELMRGWLEVPGLSMQVRDQLGNAIWIACNCTGTDASEDRPAGQMSQPGLQILADLIDWLRDQPEPLFRRREAVMLCEQMRCHRGRPAEIESFEELVGLLTNVDDIDVSKEIAIRLAGWLPGLLLIAPDDRRRYEVGLTQRLDDDQADLPDPDKLGVANSTLDRMERLADALSQFDRCLDAAGDPVAAELRASVLIAESELVARLGQQSRFDAIYDGLVALGDAALVACDRLVERGSWADQQGDDRAPAAIAGALMLKAGLLTLNEDDDAALVVFTEVIDRFGERDEPTVAAMVRTAREMQREIIEEDED